MSEIADLYNESYHNNFKKVVDENKRLKKENEELRKEIQEEINASQKWYQLHTHEKFKADKYKNALDEIEEILEVNKKELEECLFNDIDGQILQKIKEVKGE